MKNRRNITEWEAKMLAAVILIIVIATVTGIIALANNTSFETWLGMFFCTLIVTSVLIYIMAS